MGLRQLCCAGVEPPIQFDFPKVRSEAFAHTEKTALGKYTAPIVATKDPDQSGFHLMLDGTDALAARLVLARKAEKCIDTQYYLIKDDIVGGTFLHTLL